MRKGEATRERILQAAEASVLAKGFGATSIEELIAETGITKSGFFYHFRDKNELAREMLRRYIGSNEHILDEVFAQAAELADDPLQMFLIALKLLAKVLSDLPGGHPGCLTASICYQERLFDREVVQLNRKSVEDWSARILAHLRAIAEIYEPREAVDLRVLAEMLSCMIDGGIIMSKVHEDPCRLAEQVLAYRAFIKLQFSAPVFSARPRLQSTAAQ